MSPRVLIAGAGVAAVEAVLALREFAGRNVGIELLAPTHELEHRPASVAAPFGLAAPPPLALDELAARYSVRLVRGELVGVDVPSRTAHLAGGGDRTYDLLLVAVGARPVSVLSGAVTFRGPVDVPIVERLLDNWGDGGSLVVAVPPGSMWPLPAYELAIMAATRLRRPRAPTTVTVVTAERAPLRLFGDSAGAALRTLFTERGIGLRTQAKPVRVSEQGLWLESEEVLPCDAVLSLPGLEGPRIPGLPTDSDGFLPTDAHGYVSGAERVLAAGDATTFPVKQGGLATQQADAAAATIAAELGAAVTPRPFAPVLRGLLLTGGAPLYLRAELDFADARRPVTLTSRQLRSDVSTRALWWPPGKIAGRYLAPYLATARPASLGDHPMFDRVGGAGPSDPAEHEAALELALLLADEDEAVGDTAQALHALDAAAALAGGTLPREYAERRERWRAQLAAGPTSG